MKNKHKNRNRLSTHSNQPSTPTPVQSTSPSAPASPPPSSLIPDADGLMPALLLLHAFQHHLSAQARGQTADIDLNDPRLPKLLDTYAMILQLVTLERLAAVLDRFPKEDEGTPEHIKLLKMMLNALTTQERGQSRRAREEAARQRELRRQAKEAAGTACAIETQRNAIEAQRSAIEPQRSAIETKSKDARVPHETSDSPSTSSPRHFITPPLLNPQDATVPHKAHDFGPATNLSVPQPSSPSDSECQRDPLLATT